MSNLIVEVCEVSEVHHHPDADRLDVAKVKGWQCVVGRDTFKAGDRVVYFPPDTVLPEDVSGGLGVTQYLSKGRVRQIKLRGIPSFGLAVPIPYDEWQVGREVAGYYGATKYEPPVLGMAGDIMGSDHPLFVRYTDIENLRNYPDIFEDGEEVVVTEKIHGTNVRIGMVEGEWMAGSHKMCRKRSETDEDMARNFYWSPYLLPGVRSMIELLAKDFDAAILFGETYGSIQKHFNYGIPGRLGFRAFDFYADGEYYNDQAFAVITAVHKVPVVPWLWMGPFSLEKIAELSSGKTCMPILDGQEGHIREGVVIRPVKERWDERVGRVIMKYLNDDYLLSKKRKDDTTDE